MFLTVIGKNQVTTSLSRPIQANKYISINNIHLENGFYNVSSNLNNHTILFEEAAGGGQVTATVTNGVYIKPTALQTAIKTALEAASVNAYTYTVNISTTSYLCTISTTANFEIDFTNSKIAEVLGYQRSMTTAGTSCVGSYPVNYYPFRIGIRIKELTQAGLSMSTNVDGCSDVIAILETNTFGQPLIFHKNDSYEIELNRSYMFKTVTIHAVCVHNDGTVSTTELNNQPITIIIESV